MDDDQMWDFEGCKTYSDLPIVKIIGSPFTADGPSSYGIICIAKDTGRCLMIRRKHSIGLLAILKGFYKREDIPSYIRSMPPDEKKILIRSMTSLSEFSSVVYETFGYSLKQYEKDSYDFLLQCRPLIEKTLELTSEVESELEYSWPKGQKIVTDSGDEEDGQRAALRELLEESGIDSLDSHHALSSESISCSATSSLGYVYRSHFWVCVLKTEFDMPLVSPKEIEVSERSWIHINNVRKHIPPRLYSTWERALEIYRTMCSI